MSASTPDATPAAKNTPTLVGKVVSDKRSKTITVLMHVPVAGMSVKLKVENADDAASSVETDAVATTAGWQTLSFDFSRQSARSSGSGGRDEKDSITAPQPKFSPKRQPPL